MPPRTQENVEGIESFQLPKALVTRIAKSNLPGETKFQKDTVNALVDSATVFINFLAATAHEVATSHSRKTIAASDILQALELIELSEFVPLLEGELEIYRSTGKGPKSSAVIAKSKGKEKETLSETVYPNEEEGLTRPASQEELEEEEEEEEEGDQGTQEGHEVVLKNVDDEEDAVEEDLNEEQDEDEQDRDDEPEEELVDNLAIEDEELRKDNQGLEDHHNEED